MVAGRHATLTAQSAVDATWRVAFKEPFEPLHGKLAWRRALEQALSAALHSAIYDSLYEGYERYEWCDKNSTYACTIRHILSDVAAYKHIKKSKVFKNSNYIFFYIYIYIYTNINIIVKHFQQMSFREFWNVRKHVIWYV